MSTLATTAHSQKSDLIEPRRSISILGSTGSIGKSTLAVIRKNSNRYRIAVLTANNNVEELIKQAKELRPEWVVIGNEEKYEQLKHGLDGLGITISAGFDAIVEAAAYPSDIVLEGIVGAAGLKPTFAAIRRGAIVAIANKEPLVCAGELIRREAWKYGATILPVDSEHNAIYQVFDFERPELVDRIILTASGGPFRNLTYNEMRQVSISQTVAHPNWSMGAKISVDSATMINKGLEMIEAFHLFPVKAAQIDTIVHPESIIHSMVEYRDGSMLAQMGPSDMTIPIAYALSWPSRMETPVKKLDLLSIKSLNFEAPDEKRFPALRVAREVLENRGISPIIFNAANEIAVEHFLKGHIGFLEIVPTIERILSKAQGEHFTNNTLEDILSIDHWARRQTNALLRNYNAA